MYFTEDETYSKYKTNQSKNVYSKIKGKSLEIGTSEERTSMEGGGGEGGGSDESKNPKPKSGLSLDDENS